MISVDNNRLLRISNKQRQNIIRLFETLQC